MNGVEFSFNWFYADDRDIAMFSSGRLPIRAPAPTRRFPTIGTGEYDWRGLPRRSPGTRRRSTRRVGRDRQLEQQAGAPTSAPPTTTSRTARSTASMLLARPRPAGKKHTLRDARGRDEQGGDAGPPRRSACGRRSRAVLRTGPAPSARAEQHARAARRAGARTGEPARPRTRRQDRRPRRRRHGRGVAAARRRGDEPRSSARSSAEPGGAAWAQRRPERAAARPTSTAGTATSTRTCGRCSAGRARAVLASLLRRGRTRGLPRRRSGPRSTRPAARARGDAGAGSVGVARRCDGRADPLHVGRPARHHALDEPADLPAGHVVLLAPARAS